MAKAKSKKTNGAGAERFAGAIAASEANTAAAKKSRRGEQTRIEVDMRDVVRRHAEHEVPRPMSEAGFRQTAAQSAREHNKIKAIEAEIEDFAKGKRMVQGEERPSRKDEIKQLRESTTKLDRELEAESHLILTPCIELHDVNRGVVSIYIDDNGEPGEKVTERRMTAEERKRAGEPVFAPPSGEVIEIGDTYPEGATDGDDATGGDA